MITRYPIDLWAAHHSGSWIAITTNGDVRSDGTAVMGGGTAIQAAQRFPNLPYQLGQALKTGGNRLHVFNDYRVITFPTKQHWQQTSNPKLIATSCRQLRDLLERPAAFTNITPPIYLPSPGTGLGNLTWEQVSFILEHTIGSYIRDHRIIIVTKPK